MMTINNLNISTINKASELPTFSSLFTQVFDIGYGQLCNYLEPEDIFSMFQVNKECAETVTEFLKNYKRKYIPWVASMAVKENHLEFEYNWNYNFRTVYPVDYPTFITFYSKYETYSGHPGDIFQSPFPDISFITKYFSFISKYFNKKEPNRIINYYLQIQQSRERYEGSDFQLFLLDKGHYYSLLIQHINYKLKAIKEKTPIQQPELWSNLHK
jgi:hypothetical protein